MNLTISSVELVACTTLRSIIGQIQANNKPLLSDILQGKSRLPLANRRAMAYLQSKDRDLIRVKELLMAGHRSSVKRDFAAVKVYSKSDVITFVDTSL